jgi:Fic family protein
MVGIIITKCYYHRQASKECRYKQGVVVIFEIPPPNLDETMALTRIDELRRELRHYVAEPTRWAGQIRRVLAARAIQGSNSIEGFNVSVEDAIAAIEGDEPTEATLENWQANQGYRRAMTYVLQLARDEHFAYSSQLISSLHFMIAEYAMKSSPGIWRPGPIWVRNEATGEVVYEAPDGEEVPALVEELVAQLQTDLDIPVLVRAAMAHLNLVMIHPFRDGNGRMARCLQTLVLARDRILEPPFSSIEEYLGVNTESYYRVLADVGKGRWSPDEDAQPWVRYCLQAHYVQAGSVLRRVRESEAIWSKLDSLRQRHGLSERTITPLFDATIGLRVRNSSYRSALKKYDEEISNQVATSDLRGMVQAGLLRQFGAKRGAYYRAADPLEAIFREVRSDRTPIDASALFSVAA